MENQYRPSTDSAYRLIEVSAPTWMAQQNETNNTGWDVAAEPPFLQQLVETWQVGAYKSIHWYWSPLIVFTGIIGNILSLLVLLRPRMRSKSTFVYLAGVAIADLVYLHVDCFRHWMEIVTDNMMVANHNWLCKTVCFLAGVSSHYSVWLIVLVTVERFVVTLNPLMGPVWCQRSRCLLAMATLLGVVMAINAHFLWTSEVLPIPGYNVTECSVLPEFSFFRNEIWHWLDTAIYSFVPFAIIITLNVLIISKTRGAGRLRRAMSTSSQTAHEGSHRDATRLTTMLLTLSFAFLLTTSPMSMFLLYKSLTANRPDTVDRVADNYFTEAVCLHLMWTNHAINFFLYCLVGKKFREELKLMLLCRWAARIPRRASTTLTSSLRKDIQDIKLESMKRSSFR